MESAPAAPSSPPHVDTTTVTMRAAVAAAAVVATAAATVVSVDSEVMFRAEHTQPHKYRNAGYAFTAHAPGTVDRARAYIEVRGAVGADGARLSLSLSLSLSLPLSLFSLSHTHTHTHRIPVRDRATYLYAIEPHGFRRR